MRENLVTSCGLVSQQLMWLQLIENEVKEETYSCSMCIRETWWWSWERAARFWVFRVVIRHWWYDIKHTNHAGLIHNCASDKYIFSSLFFFLLESELQTNWNLKNLNSLNLVPLSEIKATLVVYIKSSLLLPPPLFFSPLQQPKCDIWIGSFCSLLRFQ